MSKKIKHYRMLRIYSNEELQLYLTELLSQGWVLDKNRGNVLTFRQQESKKSYAKVCVLTAVCPKSDPLKDDAIRATVEQAKKDGWDLLCVGDFEGVMPPKRRLYFYTQFNRPEPFPQDDGVTFQNAYRAQHTTLTWMLLWGLLALCAWLSTVTYMMASGFQFWVALLDAALLAAAIASVRLWLDRKQAYNRISKGLPPKPGDLRRLERMTLGSWAAVAASMVLLLLS